MKGIGSDLIDDKLAITKIGGVNVDVRGTSLDPIQQTNVKDLPEYLRGFDPADIKSYQIGADANLVKDISTGIGQNLGLEAQSNFDKLFQGQYKGDSTGFLKVIKQDPGFVNKWINMRPKKVNAWYDSLTPGSTTPDKNPFEDTIFPSSESLDQTVKVDATGQQVDLASKDPGGFSLLNNKFIKMPAFNEFTGQAVTSVGTSLLTAAVQGGPEFPEEQPRAGLYFDDSYRYRSPQTLTNQPGTQFGMEGLAIDPAAFIANNMSLQGNSQGLYGMDWFPGFNYGFPQQQQGMVS